MTTRAEKLIERARLGEKLTSFERRLCVAYLQATDASTTKVALADLFHVSEGLIRADILKIRQEKAELIRAEDPGLVFADIANTWDKGNQHLERGLSKCTIGTRTHLEYTKALMRAQIDRVELLQSLGWLPHNLGNMTQTHFNYTSIVTKDGSVDTRPTNLLLNRGDDAVDVAVLEISDGAGSEDPDM